MAETFETPKSGLLDGVQCLRFVAALLVVLTHSTFYAAERLIPDFPVWSRGTIGVDIFFVISGLVMWVSAGRLSGTKSAINFLTKRAKRIVPLYWSITSLKLAVLLLAPAMVLHSSIDWSYIAKSYFFIPAFNADGRIEPLLGVGWTLIFEVFFYFIFAIGLMLRAKLLPFVGGVLGICAALALVRQDNWPALSVYFDFRIVEFIAGMLIGRYLVGRSIGAVASGVLLLMGSGTIFLIPSGSRGISTVFDHVLPATAVVASIVGLERYVRWPRTLKFLGDASYSLYLIHPITAPAVPAVLAKLGIVSAPLSIAGSVAAALVSAIFVYLAVERPLTSAVSGKYMPTWLGTNAARKK